MNDCAGASYPPRQRPARRRGWRLYESTASSVVTGVARSDVWAAIRQPGFAGAVDPGFVLAFALPGTPTGVGEQHCYVFRDARREHVTFTQITALEQGRMLELTTLNQPFEASRRFSTEDHPAGTLLRLESRVRARWTDPGIGQELRRDDGEYAHRAAQVLSRRSGPA